jgi:hypothetical protein
MYDKIVNILVFTQYLLKQNKSELSAYQMPSSVENKNEKDGKIEAFDSVENK